MLKSVYSLFLKLDRLIFNYLVKNKFIMHFNGPQGSLDDFLNNQGNSGVNAGPDVSDSDIDNWEGWDFDNMPEIYQASQLTQDLVDFDLSSDDFYSFNIGNYDEMGEIYDFDEIDMYGFEQDPYVYGLGFEMGLDLGLDYGMAEELGFEVLDDFNDRGFVDTEKYLDPDSYYNPENFNIPELPKNWNDQAGDSFLNRDDISNIDEALIANEAMDYNEDLPYYELPDFVVTPNITEADLQDMHRYDDFLENEGYDRDFIDEMWHDQELYNSLADFYDNDIGTLEDLIDGTTDDRQSKLGTKELMDREKAEYAQAIKRLRDYKEFLDRGDKRGFDKDLPVRQEKLQELENELLDAREKLFGIREYEYAVDPETGQQTDEIIPPEITPDSSFGSYLMGLDVNSAEYQYYINIEENEDGTYESTPNVENFINSMWNEALDFSPEELNQKIEEANIQTYDLSGGFAPSLTGNRERHESLWLLATAGDLISGGLKGTALLASQEGINFTINNFANFANKLANTGIDIYNSLTGGDVANVNIDPPNLYVGDALAVWLNEISGGAFNKIEDALSFIKPFVPAGLLDATLPTGRNYIEGGDNFIDSIINAETSGDLFDQIGRMQKDGTFQKIAESGSYDTYEEDLEAGGIRGALANVKQFFKNTGFKMQRVFSPILSHRIFDAVFSGGDPMQIGTVDGVPIVDLPSNILGAYGHLAGPRSASEYYNAIKDAGYDPENFNPEDLNDLRNIWINLVNGNEEIQAELYSNINTENVTELGLDAINEAIESNFGTSIYGLNDAQAYAFLQELANNMANTEDGYELSNGFVISQDILNEIDIESMYPNWDDEKASDYVNDFANGITNNSDYDFITEGGIANIPLDSDFEQIYTLPDFVVSATDPRYDNFSAINEFNDFAYNMSFFNDEIYNTAMQDAVDAYNEATGENIEVPVKGSISAPLRGVEDISPYASLSEKYTKLAEMVRNGTITKGEAYTYLNQFGTRDYGFNPYDPSSMPYDPEEVIREDFDAFLISEEKRLGIHDEDNDGVYDQDDVAPDDPNIMLGDADNDGIDDFIDEYLDDRDNDGTVDSEDDFPDDPNYDTDTDQDGVADELDAFPYDSLEQTDTDGDGVGDNLDDFPEDPLEQTDTDGDGVGDNLDDFPNNPNEFEDLDFDGLGDSSEDPYPNDRDNDGTIDAEDEFPDDPNEWDDIDGDGVGDNEDAFFTDPDEWKDTDGDGVGDNSDDFPDDPEFSSDIDGDGYADEIDEFPNDPNEAEDQDGDGIGDNEDGEFALDFDNDGVDDPEDDFPEDPTETTDTDGDGVGDNTDAFIDDPNETTDTDGDGVGDNSDQFIDDPNETTDSDGDGVGDNADAFDDDPNETTDSDGDGVGDNTDEFPDDPDETVDSDGDGMGDNEDMFPDDADETIDSDGDGLGDNEDDFPNDPDETIDSDGDGLGDNEDEFDDDPNAKYDTDGDGTADFYDDFPEDSSETTDSDGDGVGDNADDFPDDPNFDTDTDGDGYDDSIDDFPNDADEWEDQDSDGVGDNEDDFPIDPSETTDSDGDGVGDNADDFPDDPDYFSDRDGDTVPDEIDDFPDDERYDLDTDGDNTPDEIDDFPNDPDEDTDSDGDGTGDNEDVFPYNPNEIKDSDADGVGDNADAFPDDATETLDSDGDGVGNNEDAFDDDPNETKDSDGDGVGDNEDAFDDDPNEIQDSDGDGVGDNADAFPLNEREQSDRDGDGIGDNTDAFPDDADEWNDMDEDGVGDNEDEFPEDPLETKDSDGDGVGDRADDFPDDPTFSSDIDGDGYADEIDDFPEDPNEAEDQDGDGIGDNSDQFPLNPNETTDTDGDGYGDNSDQFPNNPNEWEDEDGDGLGDNEEDPSTFDRDNDGVIDDLDSFKDDPTESEDSDGDGIGDNSDPYPLNEDVLDDDSDGVANAFDAFPENPNETVDSDGDGRGDNEDLFPNNPDEWEDEDGDGLGDNVEDPSTFDKDNDGVIDDLDAFIDDPNESEDSDGDGIGDNSDPYPLNEDVLDDDGDGVANAFDVFIDDPTESVDTDGDGVGDNADFDPNNPDLRYDTDGDGYADSIDSFPEDPNEQEDQDGDGIGDNSDPYPLNEDVLDADEDGVADAFDDFPEDPNESIDTDGDGVGDNADFDPNNPDLKYDSDGDGYADSIDSFPNDGTEWEDQDNDGKGDNSDEYPLNEDVTDTDGDGVMDAFDFDPNNADVQTDPNTTDTDGDGVFDAFDFDINDPNVSVDPNTIDTDGDGIPNYLDDYPDDPNQNDASNNNGDNGFDDGQNNDGNPFDGNNQNVTFPDQTGTSAESNVDANGIINGSFVNMAEIKENDPVYSIIRYTHGAEKAEEVRGFGITHPTVQQYLREYQIDSGNLSLDVQEELAPRSQQLGAEIRREQTKTDIDDINLLGADYRDAMMGSQPSASKALGKLEAQMDRFESRALGGPSTREQYLASEGAFAFGKSRGRPSDDITRFEQYNLMDDVVRQNEQNLSTSIQNVMNSERFITGDIAGKITRQSPYEAGINAMNTPLGFADMVDIGTSNFANQEQEALLNRQLNEYRREMALVDRVNEPNKYESLVLGIEDVTNALDSIASFPSQMRNITRGVGDLVSGLGTFFDGKKGNAFTTPNYYGNQNSSFGSSNVQLGSFKQPDYGDALNSLIYGSNKYN